MASLDLAGIEGWARSELDGKNAAREQALRWSRELIRACANSIRAIHRREFAQAAQLLAEANALNAQICAVLAEMGDLYWTGYVQDAQKELVEAHCTYALVRGDALPDPTKLGIAPAPFLNGLAEAVGELRRYLLDRLRRGEIEGCERVLGAMDDIYSLLVTLDYPDALTGGLRRTTDSTRGILEKTRGDLTLALRQEALVEALRAAEGAAGRPVDQSVQLSNVPFGPVV
ncbi:MAG TPA: haloacid dehalogenase [Chloroflexota bacterium]|nr:haloacid dehalogenase [Chloroflexota bacterium]